MYPNMIGENKMFNINELQLIEEAIENYGSRCINNEWRELLEKVRSEKLDSQIDLFINDPMDHLQW
jgi:hypothetical protein|tara:strand:- start:342 stop:539 length:198 start_codon:yes stop_codon:yes gene_type:complete